MNDQEKAKAREWLIGLITEALDSEEFQALNERGLEEIPVEEYIVQGKGVPVMVERRFTGQRTLTITWREHA